MSAQFILIFPQTLSDIFIRIATIILFLTFFTIFFHITNNIYLVYPKTVINYYVYLIVEDSIWIFDSYLFTYNVDIH